MKKPAALSLAERYDRDGFVIVPDLFSVAECDRLKAEARHVLDTQAKPGASVYVHVAVVSPAFRALAEDPRVVDVLAEVMPHGVMFLSDKIVYKSASKTFATPWHIDFFYWRNTRPKLSVWIPLDDATADNGTLTVIPGSHKRDWNMVKIGLPSGDFQYEINDGIQRLIEAGGQVLGQRLRDRVFRPPRARFDAQHRGQGPLRDHQHVPPARRRRALRPGFPRAQGAGGGLSGL